MVPSLLTPALEACIGRTAHYPAREEIGRASIRYFALAIMDDNPMHLDDAIARVAGHPTLIAPPTFVVETAQYAHGKPNENGYFAHEWDLPAEGFRTIRAGNDYSFERPILPSDRISVTYSLDAIVEKTSAMTGRTQLFVTSTARFCDAQGLLVATNCETLVLQKLEPRA
jgi:acyl dehydratase